MGVELIDSKWSWNQHKMLISLEHMPTIMLHIHKRHLLQVSATRSTCMSSEVLSIRAFKSYPLGYLSCLLMFNFHFYLLQKHLVSLASTTSSSISYLCKEEVLFELEHIGYPICTFTLFILILMLLITEIFYWREKDSAPHYISILDPHVIRKWEVQPD